MKNITITLVSILLSFALHSQTFNGATGAISDNNCDATHDFPVIVTGIGNLNSNAFGSINFDVTHTYDADLDIYLIAPDGTTVEISTDNGGSVDNYTNTTFSYEATTSISSGVAPFTGTYAPEGNFAVLDGVNADGIWILRICDDSGTDIGTLNNWSISFLSNSDFPDAVGLLTPAAYINQAVNATIYTQVFKGGLTDTSALPVTGIQAWVGYSTTNTNPNTWTNWVPATFNQNVGNYDEYKASLGAILPQGTFYYASRIKINNSHYAYAGTNAGFWDGVSHLSGVLTVGPPLVPVNDNCSGAIPLTVNPDFLCGATTTGTVLMATASLVDGNSCSGSEDDDVWYSFVATATTHRISLLNLSGSAPNLNHSLWTGVDCNTLTLVPGSCSDPNTSNPTGLVVGQTYYLRIYSASSVPQATVFDVCIGTVPTPPNSVTLQSPITATIAPGSSVDVFGQIYKVGTTDVVTGQAPGIQSWIGISPINMDSNPATWTNWTTATFNQEVGNYDEYKATIGATLSPGNYFYATRFQLTGGEYYYGGIDINSVGGFWDGDTYKSGNLTVNMPLAPINDNCAGAIPLTVGTAFADYALTGTTYGATDSSALTFDCDGIPLQANSNVFYSVTVPSSGAVGIETKAASTNSLTDTVMLVSAGSCSSLIGMSCNDNRVGLFSKVVFFGFPPGTVLYIEVYKKGITAPSLSANQFTISAYYNSTLETTAFNPDGVSFSPNPVRDILTIKNDKEISKIDIYNLLQQKVGTIFVKGRDANVDMSSLSKGIYFVHLISGNQANILKVIKE